MKPFNIKDVIKQRVDREAVLEWAKIPEITIPKIKVEKPLKNSVWWTTFFKELRP